MLDLSNNQLVSPPDWISNVSRSLNLANNLIEEVPGGASIFSGKAESINLDDNRISELPIFVTIVEHARVTLSELFVRNNNLRERVPFLPLRTVRFDGNDKMRVSGPYLNPQPVRQ